MRAQLRAALGKYAPDHLDDLPDDPWSPRRVQVPPTERELEDFETRAEDLSPEQRAMVLLPLVSGLRASELLSLTRRSVERAAEGEELLVMRKGGKEHLLPSGNLKTLLDALLKSSRSWQHAWEILSRTSERAAYAKLRRLIRELGGEAKLRPHKLRHGFATRLARDGASLEIIKELLNHDSLETTMRYVHVSHRDAEPFLRHPKKK